jgi:iron complex transport system substrate-binding protein
MTILPRIVSFLPSATEMVCALGLSEQLIGITHECDFPPEAHGKPIVVRNVLPIESMTQNEIDAAVSERLRDGSSLYQIDEALLRDLAPDIIITQDLCQVCAPSGNEVSQVLKSLPNKPDILWMTPKSIAEIHQNLRDLGAVTGRLQQAEELIERGERKLREIETLTATANNQPRVFCMEWIDPVYCCGHWVPEMVEIAGGVDELGRRGTDSVRIPWEDVQKWSPEILVIMPCGFNLQKAIEQTNQIFAKPGWFDLPAVSRNQVYVVDANSYFARPGPRIVEGAELLAHLFHPDMIAWNGSRAAFRRVDFAKENQVAVAGI